MEKTQGGKNSKFKKKLNNSNKKLKVWANFNGRLIKIFKMDMKINKVLLICKKNNPKLEEKLKTQIKKHQNSGKKVKT